MDKPTALTDAELAYCRECLRNHWPWGPHKHGLIASLLAMAEERNVWAAEKAKQASTASAMGMM